MTPAAKEVKASPLPEPPVQVMGMESAIGFDCASCPIPKSTTEGVQIKFTGFKGVLFLPLCKAHFSQLLERGLRRYQMFRKEGRIKVALRK